VSSKKINNNSHALIKQKGAHIHTNYVCKCECYETKLLYIHLT